MATLPYIPINISDYLADTWHLTTEEHGAYFLLIMNYWQTEKPIPENRIKGVIRLGNERYNSVMGNLKEFFNEGANGEWIHSRIEADLALVHEKSLKASAAGKASAAKRWGAKRHESKGTNGSPMETLQQESNERVTNKNKSNNKSNNKKKNIDQNISVIPSRNAEYSDSFSSLWDVYPKHRRGNKKRAYANWKKVNPGDYSMITDHVDRRRTDDQNWLKNGGDFIPHVERFLSGERWEDDFVRALPYSETTAKTINHLEFLDLDG